ASESMLKETWGHLGRCERRRVKRKVLDMRDLKEVYGRFDIVFSTNSILPRQPSDTPRMLHEIKASLRPGGTFVAILPAFETVETLKRHELSLFVKRREQGRITGRFGIRHLLGRWDRWRAYHVDKRMSGRLGNSIGRLGPARFVWRKIFVRAIGPWQYADDGANVQRFITSEQIQKMLKRAGLELQQECPQRVEYEWKDA